MAPLARPKPNPLRHNQDGEKNTPSAATYAAPTYTSFPGRSRSDSSAAGQALSKNTPGQPPLVRASGGMLGLTGCCAAVGGLSFALLNLCSFFKGVDDSVLPAVFLEVGSTLGIGPQSLGTLGMIGAFTVVRILNLFAVVSLSSPRFLSLTAGCCAGAGKPACGLARDAVQPAAPHRLRVPDLEHRRGRDGGVHDVPTPGNNLS